MELLLKIYKVVIFTFCVITSYVAEDTSCSIKSYDLHALDTDSPWMVLGSVNEDVVTYNISLCSPINTGLCKDKEATVCKQKLQEESSSVIGLFNDKLSENASHVLEDKLELLINYEGEHCAGTKPYRSIIDFKCGKTLGSPVFLDDYQCDTYFEWQTSVMCKTQTTAKEVKCYLYDDDNKKRDLSDLVSGVHNVSTDNGIIQLGVCRSLNRGGGSTFPKDAGAVLSGKSIGDVTGPLQLNADGNLFLKYQTSDSSTTITFKCPARGYGKLPVLLSSLDKQYEIEWQTEHACPEEALQSAGCALNSAAHGVDVDLTPLKKKIFSTEVGTEYNYTFSLCQKFNNFACPDEKSRGDFPGMSVCQQKLGDSSRAYVLGQADVKHMKLRYADGVLSLTYKGGDVCHHNGFQRETIITFTCGPGDGMPVYLKDDDCTYFFEWATEYACIAPPTEEVCTVSDASGHEYDLSLLSRVKADASTWEILKRNVQSDTNSYWLNLCGPVQNISGMQCPPDAGICMKTTQGLYKNIGKEKSKVFNEDLKTITATYADGDSCSDKGDKKYSATLTLHCKLGDLDSAPVLVSSSADGCDLELEWETAAACKESEAVGSGCKVYDPVLGNSFDLNPLKKADGEYRVENNDKSHEYFINVCNNVDPGKCKQKANAGVCQHEETGAGKTFVTGLMSDSLVYTRGHLKLVYSNGDAYHDLQLRKTEILFLCDPSKGIGQPEFATETDHTYTFKWYTKYACVAPPIECSVQRGKEEYDLSSLSTSSKTWLAVHTDDTDPSTKHEYFIGVCGPLLASGSSPAVSCHTETAVCGVTKTATQESVTFPDLGHAKSGPEIVETNHLKLTYTDGGPCKEVHDRSYSTEVHLHCEKGAFDSNPEYLGLEDCVFKFTWRTEAACNQKEVSSTASNCSLYDPISDFAFNLKPLSKTGGYSVQSYDKTERFKVNICDEVADCSDQKGDTQPAACSDGHVLGTADSMRLSYAHEGLLILSYTGLDEYSTEIQFQCNPLNAPNTDYSQPRFVNKIGEKKYVFEYQTSLVCAPKPVDCVLADHLGNEYDLTALARDDDNWLLEDRFHRDIKYYINVCKPIVRNERVKDCVGGALGGCQVTEQNTYNVGYVQSKPSVSENGTISIQYHNGDLCHKGTEHESHRSMVIFFTCHQTEQGPEFREETAECQYIVDWKTPSACPTKTASGSGCKVTDPDYGRTFDLSSLKKQDGPGYTIQTKGSNGEDYTFVLNVCHELPTDASDVCKTSQNVASCQKGKDFTKDAGKVSTTLTYEDGAIVLDYEGGALCHDNTFNRSTHIEFHCHYGTLGSNGPTFIKESEECKYHFDWPTSLACFDLSVYPDCRLTDETGNEYDLGMLNLPDDNYEVIPGLDARSKFYINICGPVVNKKGIRCPPNVGSCRAKTDGGAVTFAGVGNIAQNVLKKEGSGLVIEYIGDACATSPTKNTRTTILFQCPDDVTGEVNTSPQYLFAEDDCQFEFTWTTRAACPLNRSSSPTDNTDKPVTGGACIVTNPQTGFKFDMTDLGSPDGQGYEIVDTFGSHTYMLDVCKPTSSSPCTSNPGVCQIDSADPSKHWNAGMANSRLLYNDGNLYLNYTNGMSCHGGKFERNTIITFVCQPDATANTKPEFVTESDDCTYFFDWHTDRACEQKFKCQVSSNDGMIDLSALVKTTGHYTVLSDLEKTGMSAVSYHINPCHALNPISGTRCPPGAGVCKVEENKQPLSLGRPEGPPQLDMTTNQVVLHYVNGSSCPANKNIRTSSKILFQCLKGAELGTPRLVYVDKSSCSYTFEWLTDVVCAREVEKTNNCLYFDNSTNQQFDFGKLAKGGVKEVLVSGSETYYLHVCDKVTTIAGCENDAVCRVKSGNVPESYGKAGSMVNFIPEGENIKMKYTGSTACGKGKKQAFIIFECDRGMTSLGEPEIFPAASDCTVVFNWKTPVVCPNLIMNCVTSRKGSTFDLRMLSRPDDSWILAGDNGDIFHVNLCQAVHAYPDCPTDSAICRTTNDNKVESLGTLQSQEISTKDSEIMIRYSGGSAEACSSGERASVEIYLHCGDTLGRPVLIIVHEEKCIFEFLWNTKAACSETRYPVELKDGILTEPISQTEISLAQIHGSSDFYDTLDNAFNHYKVNLLTSDSLDKECQPDAVICKHSSTGDAMPLGYRSTATFFFQGATLEATYTTDIQCDTNKNKKFSSMIEFECSAASYHIMTGPMYEYKTPDCEYVFVWYTPAMCFDILGASHQSVEQKHKTAGLIALGVVLSLLVVVVIALYLRSPGRRHRLGHRLRSLCHGSRNVGSFSYSALSNGETGESSASLLNDQEDTSYGTGKGDLASFQDNSDDDIIL